jgi:hypothetical protein
MSVIFPTKFWAKVGFYSSALLLSNISLVAIALAETTKTLNSITPPLVTNAIKNDVKTTDWAFTALQNLVERYGCLAGSPVSDYYLKNRAFTRYEFAVSLNACLNKVNELISAGLGNEVTKAELNDLQKLQEEFAAELAALQGRHFPIEKLK